MDIYGAEAHLKKFYTFIKDLQDSKSQSDSRMYQKSRDRLRNIATMCNDVVCIISDMLQEELLDTDLVEFSNCSNDEILDVVNSLESELHRLRQFAGQDGETHVMQTSSVLSNYLESTKCVVDTLGSSGKASVCANILYTWVYIRFFSSIKTHGSFKYNAKRIPRWLMLFVVAYGKHVVDGTDTEFCIKFDTWISSIQNSDAGNKYAVPYEIYQLDRSLSGLDLTLTAVVLWDILMDSGLSQLCDIGEYGVRDDAVYELCSSMNPSELDNYGDYKSNPSVLNVCKLSEVSR